MNIDKTKPVMITGATGFVAGWIVKKLLEEGFTVHAGVRNPDDSNKLKYLNALSDKLPGTIKYFKADLLVKNSYSEAMKGCELVFHTASPFINSVKNPQRDLIDPALEGTENVLMSVNNTESVKRVVLTSSIAAVFGDSKDILSLPGKISNESNWNFSSRINHQPYSYSKVLAEKRAWGINKMQNRWDLVVINPALVIGPGISPNATSESFNIVRMLGDGRLKLGCPNMDMAFVDVRDVAEAHLAAGFNPDAEGRHIISACHKSFLQLSKTLQSAFGNKYPFPKTNLPKFLLWLFGPMYGFGRKMIARNINYPWLADNSKSVEKLGINYKSIDESIVEMFQQMIDNGTFKK